MRWHNFRLRCLCTGITCTATWLLWTSIILCIAKLRRTNLLWRKMVTHPVASYTPARWAKRWERLLPWSVRLIFRTALDKSRKFRSFVQELDLRHNFILNLLNQNRILFSRHPSIYRVQWKFIRPQKLNGQNYINVNNNTKDNLSCINKKHKIGKILRYA